MPQGASDRIASLDLIRGIAVLGILAINIAGFAGPSTAASDINAPIPASAADRAVYALNLLVFEGKMRGLFSLLFGASMAVFLDRMTIAGKSAELLQARRLFWLMVFGQLHYFLFWWGDILFLYGACGLLLLLLSPLEPRAMAGSAVLIFLMWHGWDALMSASGVAAEHAVALGTATAAQADLHDLHLDWFAQRSAEDLMLLQSGFFDIVSDKIASEPFWLFTMVIDNLGETLPMMIIGMALARSGFFAAQWPRVAMWLVAIGATALGLVLTAFVIARLWVDGFPPIATNAAMNGWLGPAHLLMTLGYAAMLVLAAPALGATALGQRVIAAGRLAFSNYIGTTIVMTAIFYGWGLGWIGLFGEAQLTGFVLLGWVLMLAWSRPWLAHFRQGPLEWLWRSLSEGRIVPFRRERRLS
ncbi:DUF418 domain-containing protein [Novosphingobium aquimarinum]|uniref:DUF418 domain-containing protein n=1 Tax=Novosphingobium aquimarinum TaxID=2682494 RepID=UPI0012EB0CE5|nr:DUF418 domain-containing protein [Novosphingobium aquimarinum]